MAHQCDCCRTRQRSDEELKKLTHRLSRIEGQVRGLREMLQHNAYCTDILTQVSQQLQPGASLGTYPHLCDRRHSSG